MHFIIVDPLRLTGQAIVAELKTSTGYRRLMTMGQMPAVGQAHGQHPVSHIQHAEIYRQVGGRTAVGLHIGVVGPEKRLAPVHGDALDLIRIATPGVEPPPRIPFNGFGVEHRPQSFHNRRGRMVFSGNEIQRRFDALRFLGHQSRDFRIIFCEIVQHP